VELGELLLISMPLALVDITELLADDGEEGEEEEEPPAASAGGAADAADAADDDDEGAEDAEGGGSEGIAGGGSGAAADEEAEAAMQELQRQLQAAAPSMGQADRRWLQLLCDGSEASCAEVPQLAELAAARQQGAASPSGAAAPPSAAALQAKVQRNYLSHGTEDLGLLYATALSDAQASGDGGGDAQPDLAIRSPAGIWPEAALINHSCMPNAASLVHKGRLYVRAARGLAKQGEVALSYLGDDLLAPRKVRAWRARRGSACQGRAAPPTRRARRCRRCASSGCSASTASRAPARAAATRPSWTPASRR
jgi:hypothetical protein